MTHDLWILVWEAAFIVVGTTAIAVIGNWMLGPAEEIE